MNKLDEVKGVIEITLNDSSIDDKQRIQSLAFYNTQLANEINFLRSEIEMVYTQLKKERHHFAKIFCFIQDKVCEKCKRIYESKEIIK